MLAVRSLAAVDPSFSMADLRLQMLAIVIGLVVFVVGAAAVALFLLRRKSRDLTLMYFSIFATLYALRIFALSPFVGSLAGISRTFSQRADLWITMVILIPFLLFLRQVRGQQVDKLVKVLVTIVSVVAIVAIAADLFGANPQYAYAVESYLALILVGGLVAHLFVLRFRGQARPWNQELRVLATGLTVFAATVLQGNLVNLHFLPQPNIEKLGFLFFVGCLGYVAAHRTLANEERLTAINKELEIARQIQACTLPQSVPRIAGLDIAARYRPMSQVAGDFYDFLIVDEKHLGVLIADVTGHGVPAALIASMLKVAFAEQFHNAADPVRVLTGLNKSLCGKFEEHFVTAAYVFLDLDSSLMRYAGAGHPPLMLATINSPATVRMIEQNGLMLGLFPEASYSAQEIQLRPGDRCLLYTDGAFEAANAALEEFGKPRLAKILGQQTASPADQCTSNLLDEIGRWSGSSATSRQDDDITILVLDFKPASQAGQ